MDYKQQMDGDTDATRHAAMQPCSHAAMQPCSHADMQTCRHADRGRYQKTGVMEHYRTCLL